MITCDLVLDFFYKERVGDEMKHGLICNLLFVLALHNAIKLSTAGSHPPTHVVRLRFQSE